MRKFIRDWWAIALFGVCCVFAADRIWRIRRQADELVRCKAELGEYQQQAVRDIAAAVSGWADAGADPHGEAARDMDRLMRNGF